MPNLPLDHVRRPDLPWRASTTTECGRDSSEVKSISRDDLIARLRDWGSQRTSLHTCMTCWTTANNYQTFDQNPGQAMAREVRYGESGPQITAELRALAALAVKYKDEFDEFVAGLGEAANLAERRRQRRMQVGGHLPPRGA